MISQIWRRYVWLRYVLFDRRRHTGLSIENLEGRSFIVLPEVFNPALFWTSELMLNALAAENIGSESAILDLGSGSGVLGVSAALRSASVMATDINPSAVRCTRINALIHQVDDLIDARAGNLFEPVGDSTFDLILFNPPYLAGAPNDALEQAFFSPDILGHFFESVAQHLNPNGIILLALSSHADTAAFDHALAEGRFHATTAVERRLPGERLFVQRLTPVEKESLGKATETPATFRPIDRS